MGILRRIFGGTSGDGGDEYARLVAQAREELKLETSAQDGVWRLGEAAWNVDQARGVIVFAAPTGVTATRTVQVVGTFRTEDSTWVRPGDHPAVIPALQAHARRVRAYGEQHRIERLTTRKFRCDESAAWEFTAVACKLSEAQGGYRGPAGHTLVFMTFDDVKLST